jgi:hypothetical protein
LGAVVAVVVVVVVVVVDGAVVVDVVVEVELLGGAVDGATVEVGLGAEVGIDVDGAEDSDGGGVSRTSLGTDVVAVSDVVEVVDESDGAVLEVVVVVEVVELDVASTTGIGSHVKGDEGRTGNGSPGGSVAAGSCSTTL